MADIIQNLDDDYFINEVKTHECIWNYKCEQYSDRIKKDGAWTALCVKFVPDFDNKTVKEKNQIAKALQKKWKVFIDGFNRYVSKTKNIKSGSGASKIRQYVYFHQLSFLLPLSKEKAATINSLEDGMATEDAVIAEEQTFQRGRKRASAAKEDSLIKQLAANLNKKYTENSSKNEADDDKLFLLALHGDFKKISDDFKLDAKTEILRVLKKYKVLSSDNNLYSSQPIQPSYSQLSHQPMSYSLNYDDFNSGYNHGPSTSTYVQRANQPEISTSTHIQPVNQPLQNTRETEATHELSPGSGISESSQSSIHSIYQ